MVDKDNKKGHNSSMYSRDICYKPALAFNTHTLPGVLLKIGQYLRN